MAKKKTEEDLNVYFIKNDNVQLFYDDNEGYYNLIINNKLIIDNIKQIGNEFNNYRSLVVNDEPRKFYLIDTVTGELHEIPDVDWIYGFHKVGGGIITIPSNLNRDYIIVGKGDAWFTTAGSSRKGIDGKQVKSTLLELKSGGKYGVYNLKKKKLVVEANYAEIEVGEDEITGNLDSDSEYETILKIS